MNWTTAEAQAKAREIFREEFDEEKLRKVIQGLYLLATRETSRLGRFGTRSQLSRQVHSTTWAASTHHRNADEPVPIELTYIPRATNAPV